MLTIKTFFFSSVLPAALCVTGGYQLLMGLNGPEGRAEAERLASVSLAKAADVAALDAQRLALEARADRLASGTLDEDLLEERVRANLGHMRPGEYRIPADELDALAASQLASSRELTNLIAVALLENAGA
ncbi:MAG: septum formation initiator family protein [Parvularculaceae bacterium]|nr:septum formation initiator family protein [Parvularculaceae bacterium]